MNHFPRSGDAFALPGRLHLDGHSGDASNGSGGGGARCSSFGMSTGAQPVDAGSNPAIVGKVVASADPSPLAQPTYTQVPIRGEICNWVAFWRDDHALPQVQNQRDGAQGGRS